MPVHAIWADGRIRSVGRAKGSILLVALMVIGALSLLGILAIHTTTVELEIARNHRDIRETFYLAEAAAMEGLQRLLNAPAVDLAECHLHWHHSLAEVEREDLNFRNPTSWQVDDPQSSNARVSALDASTFMTAVESRVAGGSSLITTGSRLYVNRVYGLSQKYHADNLIQIGYYMRY